MRINWFLPAQTRDYNKVSASIWIRCLQLIPYLAAHNITSVVNDPGADADVAYFIRWQDDRAYEQAKRQKAAGRKVIFDLVVNHFTQTDQTAVSRGFGIVTETHYRQTMRMLELADAVTCASQYIAERAAPYHDHVHYLSDSIDMRHFDRVKDEGDFYRQKLRVIWSGTSTKRVEFTPLIPLLKKYQLSLAVISDHAPLLGWRFSFGPYRLAYRWASWRYETFPGKLLMGEIGISYRDELDSYNLGHSLFKIGVMMAQGIPVVASPIPSYRELVNRGGGVIASTLDEWDQILGTWVTDRDKLAQTARQARGAVSPYTTANIIRGYLELLNSLL